MSAGGSERDGPYSRFFTILLWLGWLFGFGGIHRFYLGKPVTGILYLLTWGLCGVGQIIDLTRIDQLVEDANANARRLAGHAPEQRLPTARVRGALPPADPKEAMRVSLLRAASKSDGKLTVTQGVMASGKSFKEVEKALDDMAKSGYVGIDNDPDTGAVVYVFGELEK